MYSLFDVSYSLLHNSCPVTHDDPHKFVLSTLTASAIDLIVLEHNSVDDKVVRAHANG